MEKVEKLASENGILIFSKSSCCMCLTVEVLFQNLGAKPHRHEIDLDPDRKEIENALKRMGYNGPVPAVFIAGVLVGSTNEVISLLIRGSLASMIKPYQQTAANMSSKRESEKKNEV